MTDDPATLLETPDAFLSWLPADDAATVGLNCSSSDCPLARFLLEQTGTAYRVGVEEGMGDDYLSDWAIEFVGSVDRLRGPYATAGDCRAILREIQP